MRWAASDVSPSSHLAFHIPTLAGFCLLFVLFSCLVLLLWCVFGFLFCECLGIPNSPRSLDLDDRQGLIARSAMQQKKQKKVEVRSMVGDKMFQATHIVDGCQRPCVLHGYGGAKSSMPTSLPELATKGWTVIAAALLGTNRKPPL